MKTVATKQILSEKLIEAYGVLIVLLFGSEMTGETHRESDIDIGIVFEDFKEVQGKVEYATADILSELHKVFPEKEIDLVFLQETSLALQHQALAEGKILLVTNENSYADYVEYILKRHGDFLPTEREFVEAVMA